MVTQNTQAQKQSAWAGKIHVVELYQPGYATRKVLALARVAIGKRGEVPSLTLGGFKVLDGQNGLWVAMPAEKNATGEWTPTIEPCDSLKDEILRVILEAFASYTPAGGAATVNEDIPF